MCYSKLVCDHSRVVCAWQAKKKDDTHAGLAAPAIVTAVMPTAMGVHIAADRKQCTVNEKQAPCVALSGDVNSVSPPEADL